jgi:hypothetical protein
VRQDEHVRKNCESGSCISMDAGYIDHASCIMSQENLWYVFSMVNNLFFFFGMVVQTVYIKMGELQGLGRNPLQAIVRYYSIICVLD